MFAYVKLQIWKSCSLVIRPCLQHDVLKIPAVAPRHLCLQVLRVRVCCAQDSGQLQQHALLMQAATHAQPPRQYCAHHYASASARFSCQCWLRGATLALFPCYGQQLVRASQPANLMPLDCYQQLSLQDRLATLAILYFMQQLLKAADIFQTEPPPAWSCCTPHAPMLSSQDV